MFFSSRLNVATSSVDSGAIGFVTDAAVVAVVTDVEEVDVDDK